MLVRINQRKDMKYHSRTNDLVMIKTIFKKNSVGIISDGNTKTRRSTKLHPSRKINSTT